ncbi:MAG: nucleoside triphosphate pyrophosphatase [Leptolyngbyaceae cyanobacterium bins.59]|nr:nucleoside triphosphate pyrophosphatase [Leptolyngbyaceae cyanobacterium bins.59]
MPFPSFVLASASPARRRLLWSIGIEPIVYPSHFDESQVQVPDPAQLVETLADCKARSAMQVMWEKREDQDDRVARIFHPTTPGLFLGCDSVLCLDGEIHGKPGSPEEAITRWQRMRGQVGELYTGHVLLEASAPDVAPQPRRVLLRYQVTRVYFARVSDRQIEAYVRTGEPLNCAGAFALEGFGGCFIEKIEGCHTNVIGLSLPLLRQMLENLGHDLTTTWQNRTTV